MQRLLLIGLVVALIVLLWMAFFPKEPKDKPHPKWREAPWIWVIVGGITAAIFGLFFGMAMQDSKQHKEDFVPLHEKRDKALGEE